MRKRNLIVYYDIFLHLTEGTPPTKIANLHNVSVQSVHQKIEWMVKEGILVKRKRSTPFKAVYYTPGPSASAFIKAVEEDEKKIERTNSGAILGAPPSFTSAPATQPTLDFYTGKAPRLHRLHFTVELKRPSSRPGLKFKVPKLPSSIEWINEWKFKGGYKKLGKIYVAGWKDPVTIQYFMSRKIAKESLYIVLPALYILKEWLDSYDDVREYFFDVAKTIADEFRKSGYIISDPKPVKRFGEMAFYLPILKDIPKGKLRAQQITETVWVDFSHGFPEIETTEPNEAKTISESVQILLELPIIKQKVEEHDRIIHTLIPTDENFNNSIKSDPGGMYQ